MCVCVCAGGEGGEEEKGDDLHNEYLGSSGSKRGAPNECIHGIRRLSALRHAPGRIMPGLSILLLPNYRKP